jgi:hypothetical protein
LEHKTVHFTVIAELTTLTRASSFAVRAISRVIFVIPGNVPPTRHSQHHLFDNAEDVRSSTMGFACSGCINDDKKSKANEA